ncbi:hypothetical protein [Ramlibacter sp.]|uniref:hypothetical protein n=1 Tax=Ramlibacter sp. TaxID=1917967 RepID=UPI002D66CC5F|nr:hypothetical protein [Ramlibacter sp.]HYD77789.1 hypothetical protein [Ramlibacter sp.]
MNQDRKSRQQSQQQQQPQQRAQSQDPKKGGQQPSPEGKPQQQMGEGSYEGTRDYNQRTEEYLKSHDVKSDAEAARPRSEQEAREMKEAEREGRSHSKGEH